jgi:hypothetical protein
MAMEPINVFSRRIDPKGVLALLRSMDPSAQVVGPEDCWDKIVVSGPKRLLRRAATLTFNHDPDYYDGPGWPRQRMGMQGYFSRFPETERKPEILRLIGTFQFALATDWQPDLNTADDERLKYLYAVVRHLDGVLFSPSSLRDAAGRVLISADGDFDADAVMPKMPADGASSAEEALSTNDDEADMEPEPPTPERVARRALALTAVTARALLEQDDPSQPWVQENHRDTLAWVEAIGIGDEFEPDEWKVLQRPPGTLDERAKINATWRLEGLGVLAWALGRFELPPYDQLVNPQVLIGSFGFPKEEPARQLLAKPSLRSSEELEAFCKQMLGLHWRLRDYTLRPQAMDFREFARNCWFGTLDLTPFRLIDNDLALGDYAINDAPEDVFGSVMSAAMERHMAINWLTSGGNVYSETDTST